MHKMTKLSFDTYQSPIGKLVLVGDSNGLQRIQFECTSDIKNHWQPCNQFFESVKLQLDEYFSKKRTSFNLKLNPHGTTFQKQVWKRLQCIAYGKTKYYAEIAEEINNPKAARAIGMANNKNPIPIIIPCHRVIGKNGHLTGFAGGLSVKQQLLDLEK